MEHTVARSFADYLCKHDIICRDYYDIYVYGTELVVSFIFTTSIILFIGLLTGYFMISITHLLVFIFLRRFTGGYHADTRWKCKIITISTYGLVLLATIAINIFWQLYLGLLLVGNLAIGYLAPIENPNKPLTDKEKTKFRVLSHIVFTLLCILGLSLTSIAPIIKNTAFHSLTSVIILMIVAKIAKKVRQFGVGTRNR